MLTTTEKEWINNSLREATERYPRTLLHVFKGENAFRIHSEMASLKTEWLEQVSEAQKKTSFMIVMIQETISKAIISGKQKQTKPRKKILIDFYIQGSDTILSKSSCSAKDKKWLKIMEENNNHAIGNASSAN